MSLVSHWYHGVCVLVFSCICNLWYAASLRQAVLLSGLGLPTRAVLQQPSLGPMHIVFNQLKEYFDLRTYPSWFSVNSVIKTPSVLWYWPCLFGVRNGMYQACKSTTVHRSLLFEDWPNVELHQKKISRLGKNWVSVTADINSMID